MTRKELRMKKELELLTNSAPPGVSCWAKEDKVDTLEAVIIGSPGGVYEGGQFKLEIHIPNRYPLEPPQVKFLTPIYHPNIDTGGRICLDLLKGPPAGNWKPSITLCNLLSCIQLLMNDPNPDDPLMTEIAEEFKQTRSVYEMKAKEMTEKHALSKPLSNPNK